MLLHVSWVLDRSANTLLQTLLNQYHMELGYEFFKAKSISGFTEEDQVIFTINITRHMCGTQSSFSCIYINSTLSILSIKYS